MTGWRLGYTCGPKVLIDAMNTLQGQSTSNVTSIAQAAALAALEGTQQPVEDMRLEFDKRRVRIVELLRAIPGVTCYDPEGAFYAFPNVAAYVGKSTKDGKLIKDDVALCEYLLDVGKVAVVPGSGFGAPGHVRLSYATSMKAIEAGVARIADTLAALS
jgi:aspartate aminotransferase